MYKKGQAKFRAFLAAGIIASVVSGTQINTKAATVEQIYADAYNATVNAQKVNNQKSINDARAAIGLLNNTSASWAIGEFSKQVDKVQHPFLVKIVDAITKAQQSVAQADINAARATIDPELPQVWKNSYSQALDIVEQEIMKDLVDTYDLAAITKQQSDKDNVNTILEELKGSSDLSIGTWAEAFTAPMLSVWSDSEINNIENKMTDVSNNIDTYTSYPLNNANAITDVYEDSNKDIKLITNVNKDVYQEFYYTNNEFAIYIGEISGDTSVQHINEIYFKDNNMVKWVSQELADGETKSINVYDSSNLPDDMRAKLDSYKQTGNKFLTDAVAVGK